MGTGVPSADVLPETILSMDQWLCWRTQARNGKRTKVPVNPQTGRFGSATDPDSWTGFEEARTYASDGAADGVGFVFTGEDPVVVVDLDDCRVPETGTLTDEAADIVERLASYTEVSPSGTGVHVLVEGALPDDRNRRGSVEMYETARFFTVTGDHVDGTPLSIEPRYEELHQVHTEYVVPEAASSSGSESSNTDAATSGSQSDRDESPDGPTSRTTDDVGDASEPTAAAEAESGEAVPDEGIDLSDTELLERAKAAANGEKFARLCRGDTSGYESHSEADMALCALLAFWSGGDAQQIDRLFRESGLMREKWDERHYADGSTYGEKTIERVIAGTDEFYDPNPESENRTDPEDSSDIERSFGSDEFDPSAEATIPRLRRERDDLEAREQDHLDLIDELRTQVNRLETENERLRAELEEQRDRTAEGREDGDTDPTSTSTASRFWQWLTSSHE